MSSNTSINFYEQDVYNSLEKVILAEDVTFSTIEDISAKFYFPVMMPTANTTDGVQDFNYGQYSTSNYITLTIPKYLLFNFVDIDSILSNKVKTLGIDINGIPLQVLSPSSSSTDGTQVTSTIIPAGTQFIVEFIGGELELEKLVIVGISV